MTPGRNSLPAGADDRRVGITTTLPIEVLLAAGLRPVDLNNLFIGRGDAETAVQRAEGDGFPRNTCSWIKGIYAATLDAGIKRVAVVTGGDCSNAVALGEVLESTGVAVITFSFPARPDPRALAAEISRFGAFFGVAAGAAGEQYERLAPVRESLRRLDEAAWRRGGLGAAAVFDLLMEACDFPEGPAATAEKAAALLASPRAGRPPARAPRLGLAGVPPINRDLLDYVEALGAALVYLETPRQFALLDGGEDLADAYTRYTYPYGIVARLADIERAVAARALDGLIHYVQSFCYRGIQDIVLRKRLRGVPVLTLEGERPGPLSAQQKLRLETFVTMLA
jgi:benzoyl-CoA reductase/2-hydroxyglutaryl-CoA dehydratase subunit BcrC/BadD/HgdB